MDTEMDDVLEVTYEPAINTTVSRRSQDEADVREDASDHNLERQRYYCIGNKRVQTEARSVQNLKKLDEGKSVVAVRCFIAQLLG